MATKTPTVQPARVHSHYLDLGYQDTPDVDKEQVFVTLIGAWRGERASVTMEANRYRHSEGLSEWRIFPSEARAHVDEPNQWGAHLTDTARRRLGDAARPIVAAWLDGAPLDGPDGTVLPTYAESYYTAARHAVARAARSDRYDGNRIRRMVHAWWSILLPDDRRALQAIAAAHDQADAAYAELTR